MVEARRRIIRENSVTNSQPPKEAPDLPDRDLGLPVSPTRVRGLDAAKEFVLRAN
jgi:hypothetical protein